MTSPQEMTANLPATARPVANPNLPKHEKGTYVRLSDRTGIFRVSSFAGWGGPGYSIPTGYNLIGPTGRIVQSVTADLIRALEPDEIQQAEINGELTTDPEPPKNPLLSRMLRHPDQTHRFAVRQFGPQVAESHPLADLAEKLIPHFKQTHCWSCAKPLDNLSNMICPTCDGIQCPCGGCRCNWPYPPQSAYRRQIGSPVSQASLQLPR